MEVTRSLSKNIYKSHCVAVTEDDKCVIDSNGRVEERIEELQAKERQREREQALASMEERADGEFTGGLNAENVDGTLEEGTDGENGAVIKAASVDNGPNLEEIQAQADQILADAQAQAEQIRAQAQQETEQLRRQTLESAEKSGYDDGYQRGYAEADATKQELEAKRAQMEADYDHLIEELEPKFIDTITGLYNYIFKVDLSDNRDILVRLIDSTLRKVESSRTFIVHVSAEDYPYVNMQKQELTDKAAGGKGVVEIVEDIALSKGGCMIETDGGIFDCGIDTQLEELTKKLRVLSFDGTKD